ncbi:class I SAM-dependent methyltransferase (plasmid) [Aminobacter sp. NyZ550]|uniref:class I SAM-dependent methyltransferase n=1 Tax=Aminobacter sp. NyZ550 TaxID=2979870 RepID=UPI0021D5D408|nr:class I SAM-dependent methyltransferase [Aminobacter sp. NyZ550]WAX98153.1 class I SAM-dependent methyltransferase [Aminobacter sp. NyZ550]
MTQSLIEDQGEYWDRFYSVDSAPLLPSQFAVFAAGEASDAHYVVDFGCGNGRDSLFFAGTGRKVIGFDASSEAIAGCREKAARLGAPADFNVANIAHDECEKLVLSKLGNSDNVLVYARFLLHAIPDATEAALLSHARSILSQREGMFAVEFRTHRDRQQTKVTPQHYRRFVDPFDFLSRATASGFAVKYFVEGFGFAKYRDDDAHVARCILTLAK